MTDRPKGKAPPNGHKFSREDGSASAAGKRSGEARRRRVTLREELIALLTEEIRDKNGTKMKTQKAISTAIVRQALQGSTKAFEIIRDTIGEKPAENVNLVTADYTALDEAFAAMKGAE